MPVAFVTGGSKGIGAACAGALAEAGYDVAITFASDDAGAADTVSAVEAAGRRGLAFQADARDPERATEVVAQAEDELGPLDALVANAGVTRDGPAMRMDAEAFMEPIEVNLAGAFHVMRPVARGMARRRAGSIVALSSIVGRVGNAGQANYAASKAGLVGLVRSLAREVAPRGVRVNAVAPGMIQTRLTDVLTDEWRAALLERTALARLGEPEDVAGPVVFLCGDRSRFITGTVLDVDGGLAL
ncbi:MAG: 3-oxoacyl-ACP reductase FabG [Miltoncostaeaceae bacterium]